MSSRDLAKDLKMAGKAFKKKRDSDDKWWGLVIIGVLLTAVGIVTGLVLTILKGMGILAWSWVWATSPFWIGASTWVLIPILVLLVVLIAWACNK